MRPDDPSFLRDTEARVLAWCEQAGLFAHGQRVAAAVSGGADSMALLRILLALAGRLEVEVSACHVNHKLRGAAADADEAFVREECARLGVPLQVCRAGEDGLPLAGGGEAGARALRYACFERVHAGGIDRIATAHTVTDQAETLLFRLARGTGLHGAGGIRPARDFYVRPLLCLTRAEVEAYCRAAGQGWVTDGTNLSDAYARNRLRHDALPALRQTDAGELPPSEYLWVTEESEEASDPAGSRHRGTLYWLGPRAAQQAGAANANPPPNTAVSAKQLTQAMRTLPKIPFAFRSL